MKAPPTARQRFARFQFQMDVSFNSLPLEIQTQVCSYLSLTELQQLFAPVCKKWKNIASQPMLRKHVTLDFHTQTQDTNINLRQLIENLTKIVRKSFKVRSISFVHISKWYALSRSIPKCNYLRKLEFTNCNLDLKCMKRFIARFPEIESVRLTCIHGQPDLSVIQAIADWRFIKDISIDGRTFQCNGSEIIEFFARNCEYLREMELINCRIWNYAIEILTELRGSTLEKINLSCWYYVYISDRPWIIDHCLQRCPNLKVIYLYDEHGPVRFENNTLLEELNVQMYQYLPESLESVVFNHLHTLKITHHSKSIVKLLPKHCPVLKNLYIRCLDICNVDVIYIIQHCSNLKRFIVSGNKVTSEALYSIFLNPTNLKYLELNHVIVSDAICSLKPDD